MTRYDPEAIQNALRARIEAVRDQVLTFVRQLDDMGVVPGFLPPGAVRSLAEADAALEDVQEGLEAEASVADMDEIERRLDDVESHIREIQQELWRATAKQRG